MPAKRGKNNVSSKFGSKWIRREKRLAIYIRDAFRCLWCGKSVEDNGQACIDHLVPQSKGGDNDPSNLLTSCKRCNDQRGDMSAEEFIATLSRSERGRHKIHRGIAEASMQILDFHKDEAKHEIKEKGYIPRGQKQKPNFESRDPADFL